jgi:predicted Zn-dependent protease
MSFFPERRKAGGMFDTIERRFREIAPAVDFCSLRLVNSRQEMIHVRQDVLQPVSTGLDSGAMITVTHGGGLGYAATCDLSASGLKAAAQQAVAWARASAAASVVDFSKVTPPAPKGEYRSAVKKAWDSVPLGEKIELVRAECARLRTDPRIVDWEAVLWFMEEDHLFLTASGGRVLQHFELLVPSLGVTANEGSETVRRNFGGFDLGRQGGMEVLDEIRYREQAPILCEEVLQLLAAPNCPTGKVDVLLDADQMYLQVHESVGHPLELDRILGDERNYAGTSFVTKDMFGSYQYGSKLLNITFDPTLAGEFASYAYDDDGLKAEKVHIIKDGILQRPLGGAISQTRAGLSGTANSRASGWNRPPIDRMANLNLEPGRSTFKEMVAAIENGIYMKRNTSWSIDDSRNKFQFGCEYGRRIVDGELREVVKKPNYKGVSATFWRNLKMVGNRDTFQVLGTPYCGKGEPNQVVRVGHAAPACVFADVDVFGGE